MSPAPGNPSAQAHDRDELAAFLPRLIALCACDSPTGDAGAVDAAAELLAGWAAEAGLEVESFETPKGAHLRIALDGGGEGRTLLIGHHDTVWPLGEGVARPVQVTGERALGPGTADMKGGLLVGLAAMERLAHGSDGGFGRVELHSLPDEEARLGAPARADLFAGADAALVLECGRESGAVVGSRNGATWIEVEARGRSAHAGQDLADGRSALHAAIAEVARIEGLAAERPELQVTATRLLSDGPGNAVAGAATINFDVRSRSPEALAWALERAGEFGDHDGVELTATTAAGFPPMERDAALVERTLAELERAGAPVAEEHAGGASDGCWTSTLGIPTVDGLGPIGGCDHSEEEWLDLSSVGPRVEVVARLCATGGEPA
ncbi:MAG TPA: M20/M25/M40 family metallo-hydrolase [Solirubrobacterales bacterium]|nr:M20/M25/M40 family metallo-hydrolase [Solirubrobacterales bacterium]